MQIVPMRELKNTVEIERRCAEENGPVFVTKNGYGRLVVMDIEYYERTMQQIVEAQAVLRGLKDLQEGKIVDGPQTLSALRGISMSYNFKLTQQASDDLDEIIRYMVMELVNKKPARDFLDDIEETIQEACLFPESGVLVKNDFLPDIEIRKKRVNHYVLYYLPQHKEKIILILRIVYGKRNPDALIFHLEEEQN